MAKTSVFDRYAGVYDAWFDTHAEVFASELDAVRALLPNRGKGVEIGAGTGRFAEGLGVELGVEPAEGMRRVAVRRGLCMIEGVAEDLPLHDGAFDYALMITVDCFLDDVPTAFAEAYRILRTGGFFILGMLDRRSPVGRRIERRASGGKFFRDARLRSAEEMIRQIQAVGFGEIEIRQTLFQDPEAMTAPDEVRAGHGKGGFVVIRGRKPAAGAERHNPKTS